MKTMVEVDGLWRVVWALEMDDRKKGGRNTVKFGEWINQALDAHLDEYEPQLLERAREAVEDDG